MGRKLTISLVLPNDCFRGNAGTPHLNLESRRHSVHLYQKRLLNYCNLA
jgi:hypothetical protein